MVKNTKIWAVLLSAVLAGPEACGQGKEVSLEDVWKKYEFTANRTTGLNSMQDGEHYTTLSIEDGSPGVEKFSYATGQSQGMVVSAGDIREKTGKKIRFSDYQFSPDEKRLLLATGRESIYRYSSKSRYYIYDLESGRLDSLAVEGKQQLARFSPIENKVAFVKDNRLHVQDLDGDSRKLISMGRGEKNAYIAGAVDWVYEEEFAFHQGYEWSPGGRYIAYYQFDEREVPLFTMDIFGDGLYPSEEEFKYPKAGEPNSKVSIHIYDLQEARDTKVEIPEDYEYIPRIQWTREEGELVIWTLNRHQNQIKLWQVIAGEAAVQKLYEESAETYLQVHDNLRFLADGSFIWTSEQDGYNHLYHFRKGKLKQITKGQQEVTKFYGMDGDDRLYYQAVGDNPMEREVYRIGLNGRGRERLSPERGWNSAEFSESFAYYIHRHSTAQQPLMETLHQNDGKLIRKLKDNDALRKKLLEYRLSNKEFFSFKNGEGDELNGWMIKPQDFDEGKEYPVLMFVYGGPGAQTVKNQFDSYNHFYYQTLAQQGYIVVSVDNRGTGGRGRDFRACTYQQLGKLETIDQIAAGRYLQTLPYVDADRIGIWGWSYGGYMSSLCITKGADVFKMAIAVAPVTNWRFYDTIYTERYMRTPDENPEGYDDNSPLNHVGKLEGAYMLVHGSADDNVHLQNTMRMVDALVEADKQFDLNIYPDKDHGIHGGNTRYHLYQKMTDFIRRNL